MKQHPSILADLPCRQNRLDARWMMATLALLLLLLTHSASAGEVVILLSGEAEPYMQAKAAAEGALQQRKARTVYVKEAAEKGAKSVIGDKPEAVIAVGTPAALWAMKQLPPGTPLVYCLVSNPAGLGLSQRQATYGVTTDIPLPAQVKLIERALPKARSIGMLYRSDNNDSRRQLQAATDALPKGWQIEAIAIDKHASVAAAIDELMHKHVDVIWTTPDASVYDRAVTPALLLKALRSKVPVFGFSLNVVRSGALVGAGVDPRAQGRQAAALALGILPGAPAPAEPLATVHAPQFEIAVNVLVADQLGVEVPAELLQKATHVFKAEK